MRSTGFTLLEVVIALGLFFVLISLGTLTSNVYFRAQHVRLAAETVASELERAQLSSLTQSEDAPHGVNVFTDSVVRFTGDSYATRNPSLDAQTLFPATVTVTGTNEIVIPEGSYGPTVDATVTVADNTIAYDVSITTYGVITVTNGTVGY